MSSRGSRLNLAYLVLVLPFILAYLSWQFFPTLAEWLVTDVFGYHPAVLQAGWLWLATPGGWSCVIPAMSASRCLPAVPRGPADLPGATAARRRGRMARQRSNETRGAS